MKRGIVFNIQRYSIDDGPGIRTVVFLKGCPLKCRWCANPESQQLAPQILFDVRRCRNCRRCLDVCPLNDRKGAEEGACLGCGACVRACWYEAKRLCGEYMTAEQVMETVRRDAHYYADSGGGVTLSGGEPLAQAAFAEEILRLCKCEGIHTAIETAGFAAWEALEGLLTHLDLVYFDCKHVDSEKHRRFTGVDNRLILENLERVCASGKQVVVRIPCIPGFNDSREEIERIIRRVREAGGRCAEVLPFHRFGSGKYAELNRAYDYAHIPPMAPAKLDFVREIGEKYGINVTVKERRG